MITKTNVSLSVSHEMLARVDAAAKLVGKSRSAFIMDAVTESLERGQMSAVEKGTEVESSADGDDAAASLVLRQIMVQSMMMLKEALLADSVPMTDLQWEDYSHQLSKAQQKRQLLYREWFAGVAARMDRAIVRAAVALGFVNEDGSPNLPPPLPSLPTDGAGPVEFKRLAVAATPTKPA